MLINCLECNHPIFVRTATLTTGKEAIHCNSCQAVLEWNESGLLLAKGDSLQGQNFDRKAGFLVKDNSALSVNSNSFGVLQEDERLPDGGIGAEVTAVKGGLAEKLKAKVGKSGGDTDSEELLPTGGWIKNGMGVQKESKQGIKRFLFLLLIGIVCTWLFRSWVLGPPSDQPKLPVEEKLGDGSYNYREFFSDGGFEHSAIVVPFEVNQTRSRLLENNSPKGPFSPLDKLQGPLPGVGPSPDKAQVHYLNANKYLSENKPDLAVKALKRSIELDPNLGLAYRSLAISFILLAKPVEAAKAYRNFVRLEPKHQDIPQAKVFLERYRLKI